MSLIGTTISIYLGYSVAVATSSVYEFNTLDSFNGNIVYILL